MTVIFSDPSFLRCLDARFTAWGEETGYWLPRGSVHAKDSTRWGRPDRYHASCFKRILCRFTMHRKEPHTLPAGLR